MANNAPKAYISVDGSIAIEPINSSVHPHNLLDRFPDELYNKTVDSVLVKFFNALLGPSGAGWIRKNYAEVRLLFEESGVQLHQLENFYGNPFNFGRIAEEQYADETTGNLERSNWDIIKIRDESYRNRVIDFFHAARLGSTPDGVGYAARSGLGYGVNVVENYKYLFDQNSDSVMQMSGFGGNNIEEFIIIPSQEFSKTFIQTITFEQPFNSGSFTLQANGGISNPIPYNATALDVQTELFKLTAIGSGNVEVSGDITTGFKVKFVNLLSNKEVLQIKVVSSLYDSYNKIIRGAKVVTEYYVNPTTETIHIPGIEQHAAVTAIDKVKPVGTYATFQIGQSPYEVKNVNDVYSHSQYTEVVKHVTGSSDIGWPETDSVNWIESGVEKTAPRVFNDLQHHYQNFTNPIQIFAYTDNALLETDYSNSNYATIASKYISEHGGVISSDFQKMFGGNIFADKQTGNPGLYKYVKENAIPVFANPPLVTSQADYSGTAFINGIYPVSDKTDSVVNKIVGSKNLNDFWASKQRATGSEFLEIDLGAPKAINFITFETFKLPIDIEINYDDISNGQTRRFVEPIREEYFPWESSLHFNSAERATPWQSLAYHFTDGYGEIPFTRFIRIQFTRRNDTNFVTKSWTNKEWPILVKNLRIGRNV